MSTKPLLTIFGATGTQGGSIVTTVLSHPTLSTKFSLRGITRNTSSPAAQSLSSRGVSLAIADLNDPSSLHAALQDSYAVFAVTNYWESASSAVEIAQGKAIADACVAVGAKHVVWSSLYNTTKMTNGNLKHIEHFDGKSDIAEYFESVKGKAGMTVSYFMPGFYMSNIPGFTHPDPESDGVLTLKMPWEAERTQVPLFDAGVDTGNFVAGILASDLEDVDGKYVHAVSEWKTPSEIVRELSEVLGREVRFKEVSKEEFEGAMKPKMGEKVAEELTENMLLIRDYSYYGPGTEKMQEESDKVLDAGGLGLKKESFKEWAGKAKWNL